MVGSVRVSRYNGITLLFLFIIYSLVRVQCKVKDAKIIGGRDVIGDEGLFMAGLLSYPDGKFLCGAAFYTPILLATACSCVCKGEYGIEYEVLPEHPPGSFRVATGSKQNLALESRPALLKVIETFVHPDCAYDPYLEMWLVDLGVIALSTPINQSITVNYISYPPYHEHSDFMHSIYELRSRWLSGEKYCYVFGWGYTSYKMDGDWFNASFPVPFLKARAMKIISVRDCKAELCSVNEKVCIFEPPIHSAFCAVVKEPPKGSFCYGDVGSPFVCDGQLRGIVSWNHDCGRTFKTNIIYELDVMFFETIKLYHSSSLCIRTWYKLLLLLFVLTTLL